MGCTRTLRAARAQAAEAWEQGCTLARPAGRPSRPAGRNCRRESLAARSPGHGACQALCSAGGACFCLHAVPCSSGRRLMLTATSATRDLGNEFSLPCPPHPPLAAVAVVLESAVGGLVLKSGLRVIGTVGAGLLGVGCAPGLCRQWLALSGVGRSPGGRCRWHALLGWEAHPRRASGRFSLNSPSWRPPKTIRAHSHRFY